MLYRVSCDEFFKEERYAALNLFSNCEGKMVFSLFTFLK